MRNTIVDRRACNRLPLSALVCLLALAPFSRAGAAPNGLNQIPIAKIYGDGGMALSVSQTREQTTTTTFTTQLGLYNVIELGIDYQSQPSDQSAFLANVKALIAHNPGHIPDVAIGLQNVARAREASPYIVATSQPGLIGASLGAIRLPGETPELMAGLAYNLTPKLQLTSDTITGARNDTTVGVIANVTPLISVNVAYAHPNCAAAGSAGYLVNATYTFHLAHGGLTHGRSLIGESGAGSKSNGTSTPATNTAR